MDLQSLRREYRNGRLGKADVLNDPIEQFRRWLAEARETSDGPWFEVNAMTLATVDEAGRADARVVLLKEIDDRGLVFYTNTSGRKASHIAANAAVALVFYWAHLERQVRIVGEAESVDCARAKAYFARRPRGSQLGAAVSRQSRPIASRAELERRLAETERIHEGREVPMPADWGGYVVIPRRVEFWQGRDNRLHDRIQYTLGEAGWGLERLSP
jgi:pyridoxamine 5'-phosphate oxidase